MVTYRTSAIGVLICSLIDPDKLPAGTQVFGRGIYHSFDYPFYYFNIRENAANRAENFLNTDEAARPPHQFN